MIKNGQLHFSKINQCVVRVVRADQAQKVALVKHHGAKLIADDVLFSDLTCATSEQVKTYLS
jgi:hypothetical protein